MKPATQPGFRAHTIPVGGTEPPHFASPKCWCYPVRDRKVRRVIIHNALDCREAYERQTGKGLPGKRWVIVLESL